MNSAILAGLISAPLKTKGINFIKGAITVSGGSANKNLVLSSKGSGSYIFGPTPDGSILGGNPRGNSSIDLQVSRGAATQIAAGDLNIVIGSSNTAKGTVGTNVGVASIIIGTNSTSEASGNGYIDQNIIIGHNSSILSSLGSIVIGANAQSTAGGYRGIAIGHTSTCGGGVAIGKDSNTLIGGGSAIGYGARTYFGGDLCSPVGDFGQTNSYDNYIGSNNNYAIRTINNSTIDLNAGGYLSPTYFWTIPSGFAISGIVSFMAVNSTGSKICRFLRTFIAKNVGGTSSLVSFETLGLDTVQILGSSVGCRVDDATDTLRFTITSGSPTVSGITGTASTDVFTSVAHPFVDGDLVIFTSIASGGAGVNVHNNTYPQYFGSRYTITNATADTFKLSGVDITTDMTGGVLCIPVRWTASVNYMLSRWGY